MKYITVIEYNSKVRKLNKLNKLLLTKSGKERVKGYVIELNGNIYFALGIAKLIDLLFELS